MPGPNEHVTAAGLKIDGVSESDSEGRVPLEQLINGTIIRIPKWDRFPNGPDRFSILHIFWLQNNVEKEIYTEIYTEVDDQPEFTFPLTPQQMREDGVAFIYYILEGYDGNDDPSPIKKLTIDHALPLTLKAPGFPDANKSGYIGCTPYNPDSPPIWVCIRLKISAELVFREFDEFVLEWQGFPNLNIAPPPLTELFRLTKTLSLTDTRDGFFFEIPFEPYVRPMFDEHSGTAQYTIVRNGVPFARSIKSYVKIDRVIDGEPIPCGGFPLGHKKV
ncbi:hypothetical protein IAI51_13455 [Pseudomonas sp. N40(2020)]|uniref:hypothetical protein n=1 Tax=Pseudomonas sp. N40(2020) TaxID=2767798 RepID=UPI001656CECA|nr:hypothetical protein [Pseudomonas sp. N40(2020)]MBC8997536.1 hypothetical protein [Pseudomonas sp. N40(2020)]